MSLPERMKLLGHAGDRMGLRYTHADIESIRKGLEKVH